MTTPRKGSVARRMEWIAVWAVLLSGCGQPEHVGHRSEPIQDGLLALDNPTGAIRIDNGFTSRSPARQGTGFMYDIDTVVTAAHVPGTAYGDKLIATLFDPVAGDVESSDVAQVFYHPAAGRRSNQGSGFDVAVLHLEDSIVTAPSMPLLDSDAASNVGKPVQAAGFGPRFDLDETFSTIDTASERALLYGYVRKWVGHHYSWFFGLGSGLPDGGLAPAKIEGGDSGGPLANTNNNRIVGVNVGSLDQNKSIALEGAVAWIRRVATKPDRLFRADVNGMGRPDDVFISLVPSHSPPGDEVFVEFGEGLAAGFRTGAPIANRPPSLGAGEFIPEVVGNFNGGTDRDIAGLVGDRAMVVFDVASANTSPFSEAVNPAVGYEKLAKQQIDADGNDDLVATRPSGTVDWYYGAATGVLDGPIQPNRTCRARNRCGQQRPAGVICGCDDACEQRSDCCPDVTANCGPAGNRTSPLFANAASLRNAGVVASTSVRTTVPVVRIRVGGNYALGYAVDSHSILTASAAVPPGTAPGEIEMRQALGTGTNTEFTGVNIRVARIMRHPQGKSVILHVANGSGLAVPADLAPRLYKGTEFEAATDVVQGTNQPAESTKPQVYGLTDDNLHLWAAALPSASLLGLKDPPDFTVPEELRLVTVSEMFPSNDAIPLGTPVLSARTGALLGIVAEPSSEPAQLDAEHTVSTYEIEPYLVHDGLPLDKRTTPRYWLQKTLRRSEILDIDGNGVPDVFGVRADGSVAAMRLSVDSSGTVTTEGISAAPGIDPRPFGMALVGNAWLGNASRGLVWQNRITGEVQIWRTTPNPEKLSFFILPTWIISGLGDVNGDGITDFIWTNPLFNASYFWIMNDLTTFPTAVAEVTTRGQWISNPPLWPPLPLGAQPATFSLVAVDDFRFPQVGQDGFPVTGPEQSAADLVWRQLSQGSQNDVLQSPGISLWQMGYQFLDCADIGIDLVLGGCEKETGVYELVRNPEILPPQDAFWEVAGSGDFDRDGRTDLIWYAGGSGAGDLAGKFQLWRFLEDGSVSRELLHDSTGSDTIVQPGAMMFAGGVQ